MIGICSIMNFKLIIPAYTQEDLYKLFLLLAIRIDAPVFLMPYYPLSLDTWSNTCGFLDSFVVSFLNKERREINIDQTPRSDLCKLIFNWHMLDSTNLYKNHQKIYRSYKKLKSQKFYQKKLRLMLQTFYDLPLSDMPLYIEHEVPINIIAQWRLQIEK
jgi:hypothetical protein